VTRSDLDVASCYGPKAWSLFLIGGVQIAIRSTLSSVIPSPMRSWCLGFRAPRRPGAFSGVPQASRQGRGSRRRKTIAANLSARRGRWHGGRILRQASTRFIDFSVSVDAADGRANKLSLASQVLLKGSGQAHARPLGLGEWESFPWPNRCVQRNNPRSPPRLGELQVPLIIYSLTEELRHKVPGGQKSNGRHEQNNR
jgi:hypothetical protein